MTSTVSLKEFLHIYHQRLLTLTNGVQKLEILMVIYIIQISTLYLRYSFYSVNKILIVGYNNLIILLLLALCFPQFYEFYLTLFSERFSSSVFLNAKIYISTQSYKAMLQNLSPCSFFSVVIFHCSFHFFNFATNLSST